MEIEETNKTIGEGILEYNSAREKLILPEYGRNIQKLVEHAKGIEDPEKRQWYVETLIELMNQMLPGTKTSQEIADKLWNHLYFIANYELEVKVPDSVVIHKKGDVFMIPSEDMDYPQKKIPYRHYGWNVHTMVEKAKAMEPGIKRDEFSKIIGSYMKLAYRTWGKEQFVNDELIKADLRKMSGGEIDVPADASIDSYKNVQLPAQNTTPRRKNKGGSGQHGRRSNQSKPKSNKRRY